MLQPNDYVCPLCGAVLDSLTAYHKHAQAAHDMALFGAAHLRRREFESQSPAEEIARLG